MPTEDQLIAERKRKLQELRKKGINPYPYSFIVKHTAAALHKKHDKLEKDTTTAQIAGRIVGLRRMGKVTFMHIQDSTGKIQLYAQKKTLKDYDILKLLDMGDWIGIKGSLFITKTGELTINTKKLTVLSKSLRPLPEKWHGLKDKELRYRKRYLDLIMNPDVKDVFVKRAMIIKAIKEVLDKKQYIEVETPILHSNYGGASARPFTSHLNALNMNVYMRISNELHLKRLIVGGFDRVYEFAKDFRNEDIDRTHNPEFTQVEMYQAYADYEDMMALTEDLFLAAAKKIGLKDSFVYQGKKVSLKKPWKRYTMVEALKKYAKIDVCKLKDKQLKALVKKHKLDIAGEINQGKIVQALFEKLVEDKLLQPTFITHHPVESTPLCKPGRKDSQWVERFEPFIMGMEVGNAYSELNDPLLQRKLLQQQAKDLRKGNQEAHPMDEDFIQAIEYGMPPTGGLGIGIDRMCMLLLDKQSIRDVLFFPFMKPN